MGLRRELSYFDLMNIVIGAIVGINIRGVKAAGRLNDVLTLAKLTPLLIIIFLGVVSVVALPTLNLGITGLNSLIVGIGPATKKQTLIKLVLFALAYGFLNVNWIDLYYNKVPAYHVWLILTYMAPFGVLIVFQGLKDWQLALSLGLLVSLCNDVGYFTGDLFFGFHVDLVSWLEGAAGLPRKQGALRVPRRRHQLSSHPLLMGFSIYARVAVVAFLFYHWWKQQAKVPG